MTQPHYIDRLIGFAVHDDDCTVNRFPGHDACSCGLSALLQEARHARPDAPMEAVAWREKVATLIEDNVKAEKRGPGEGWLEVVGIYDAADAIIQALAVIPTQGGGSQR